MNDCARLCCEFLCFSLSLFCRLCFLRIICRSTILGGGRCSTYMMMSNKNCRYDPAPRTYRIIFSSILAIRKFYLRHLSLPRPYFLRQDVFSDKANEHGRHHVHIWEGPPYYVKPTLWNRWGPGAWISRALGVPVPGDEGDKYYPQGYDTVDLGPKYFQGKGRKTTQEIKETLEKTRTGQCPFAV